MKNYPRAYWHKPQTMITSPSEMMYCYLFLIWLITAIFAHSFIKSCLKSLPTIQNPPSPPALYFKTQDFSFSYRPEFGSSEYFIYRESRFVMTQYGDYWRFMKKPCMTRLLAVPQLNHTVDICEEEVEKLVERITKSSSEGKACDLTNEPTTLTNNTICRMALSMRFSGTENKAEEIQVLVKQCLELAGKLSNCRRYVGSSEDVWFLRRWEKGLYIWALGQFERLVERIMMEHEAKVMNGGAGDQKWDLMGYNVGDTQRDPSASFLLVILFITYAMLSFDFWPFLTNY